MSYAGVTYYEEKGVEDSVTFIAAKNLNALLEVITIMYSIMSECVFVLYSMLKIIILKLRWDRMFTIGLENHLNTLSSNLMRSKRSHSLVGKLSHT